MKNDIMAIIIAISNVIIAFEITTLLNIRNTVIFPSMGVLTEDMTYEMLIWCILTLLDAFYMEYKYVQRYKKEHHLIGSFSSVLKHIELENEKKDED